jgi:hypothetical protein
MLLRLLVQGGILKRVVDSDIHCLNLLEPTHRKILLVERKRIELLIKIQSTRKKGEIKIQVLFLFLQNSKPS